MTIKQANIKNFKSIKDITLEFHKGVNTFIGETDAGKSTILNALRWPITNRPLGDSIFPNHWDGDTTVDIILNKDISVSREKGKENLYITSKLTGKLWDNKEFEGFGTSVPEEVSKLLNISDINIQRQHESHFLITKSPGEIAKYLNKIVDLEVIDKSLSNIGKTLKNEKRLLSDLQSTEEDRKEELKKYEWIDSIELKLSLTIELEKEVSEIENKINELEDIILEINELNIEAKIWNKIVKHKKTILSLIKDNDELNILIKKITEIETLINFIKATENKKIKLEKYLKEANEKYKELMPDICPLCEQEIK